MQTFPSVKFNYLQQMDIILRMESALAGEGNMVTFALKNAIHDNKPARLIIQTTKDMIRDNQTGIENVLGIKLTQTIKNFEL